MPNRLLMFVCLLAASTAAYPQAIKDFSDPITVIESYKPAFGDTLPEAFSQAESLVTSVYSCCGQTDAYLNERRYTAPTFAPPVRWMQPWSATIFPWFDRPREVKFESDPIHGYCFVNPKQKPIPYYQWPYTRPFPTDSTTILWDDLAVTYPIVSHHPLYILTAHTTTDPRLSAWWLRHAADSAGNVWQAVQQAALTQKHHRVTYQILRHMMSTGILADSVAHNPHPSLAEVTKAMREYTYAGLVRNYSLVRQLMGSESLTKKNFATLQAGDTVMDYELPEFGPTTTPFIYPIIRIDTAEVIPGGGIGPRIRNWFGAWDTGIHWDNTDELKYEPLANKSFIAIHRKK